jgi:histidine phosphotransferase ChpT
MPITFRAAAAFLAYALVTQGEGPLLNSPDSEVLLFGASFRVG